MARDWTTHLEALIGSDGAGQFAEANASAVKKAIRGESVHSGSQNTEAGVHAVVNISCAHVPAFSDAASSGDPKPYKNFYDLGRHRVGDQAPKPKRLAVDQNLPLPKETSYKDVYFAAAELNGSGIRYYGDYCFVLKSDQIDDQTVFLDRNSFEFVLAPLYTNEDEIGVTMSDHSGEWKDFPVAATVRVLEETNPKHRRLTTGVISESLLRDEDYIEVLKVGSFGPSNLLEIRTAAPDASLEALMLQRLRSGPTPSASELLWLHRRTEATRVLQKAGCKVRVVTSPGRERR